MDTVEEGKNADLVVLDRNPIETVQNLHGINAVIRAGFYLSRDDLQGLKEKVRAEQAAARD